MSLAIIDLDGTLLEGPASSEKLFFQYLIKQRIIGLQQLCAYMYFHMRWFKVYGATTSKKNKAYLTGLKVALIEKTADEFVNDELVSRYCQEVKQRITSHHIQGDTTVLLTGSIEMIARAVCGTLNIHHLRATECSTANGFFTQEPPRVHPFGPEKMRISRDIGRQLGYELSDATAYGNDIYDIDLLEAVAHPVAVHPDKGLRKHALARSWEIVEHDD